MRPALLALSFVMLPLLAAAQAYKCTVNGKTVYADAPCARDARYVGKLEDNVTEDQQIQRLQQSIKERRQRNSIESREIMEQAQRQRTLDAISASEAAQQRAAESSRRARCSDYQYEITRSQRDLARHQDFGMQRSVTNDEAIIKRNRESMDRECR